jgi:hypothetical protein
MRGAHRPLLSKREREPTVSEPLDFAAVIAQAFDPGLFLFDAYILCLRQTRRGRKSAPCGASNQH